jgi:hypothetical protein
MIPKQPFPETTRIGYAQEMSSKDIMAANKAYSCLGGMATNGGGNQQVHLLINSQRWESKFFPMSKIPDLHILGLNQQSQIRNILRGPILFVRRKIIYF